MLGPAAYAHPASQDNCERVENTLSLWVYEARDLPPKRRYLCQLHLDGTLYARTTAKAVGPSGTLFWGEHFALDTLPPARELRVSVLREDEGRRRDSAPLGIITVPLAELATSRQPLERWYSLAGPAKDRGPMPGLRLRGRYQEIQVLPIVRYKEFAEYITFHYRELCARLEPAIPVRHKEELASALVHVLQSTGKAKVGSNSQGSPAPLHSTGPRSPSIPGLGTPWWGREGDCRGPMCPCACL